MHFIASLFSLVGFAVTAVAAIFAFGVARQYVRSRLRFVDVVRHPLAPWIAAAVGTVIMLPVVLVLSVVHLASLATALIVGGATGFGTASGVKALKRGD